MHSAGMLTPAGNPDTRSVDQKDLWNKANERISKFLGSDFMTNVVPQPARTEHEIPALLSYQTGLSSSPQTEALAVDR
jgi:hypothetical protein